MEEETILKGDQPVPSDNHEKTVYNGGQVDESPALENEPLQVEKRANSVGAKTWKAVSIGGVSGIMLGAAPFMFASAADDDNPVVDDSGNDQGSADTNDTSTHTSKEMDLDDMSFGQAFATARGELGPGQVFEWRGSLYTTDTKEEWETSHPSADEDDGDIVVEEDVSVEILGSDQDGDIEEIIVDVETYDEYNDAEDEIVAEVDDEGDVELIDVEAVPNEDGQVIVGTLSEDGEDALIVDVDGDEAFDVLAADSDGDGSLTEDEVMDIQEMELGLNDFALDDMRFEPDPSLGIDS